MKCAKDCKDVPNLQVKSRRLLSQFFMRKRREGKRMVLLSDLFAQHVKARTDLRLDKPVHEIDARCAYCVREIQQAYARSDILQPTFTDHDYFPIVSPWLCESCALMFQFGLQNAPNAWSFLASRELRSLFPTLPDDWFEEFAVKDTYTDNGSWTTYRMPTCHPSLAYRTWCRQMKRGRKTLFGICRSQTDTCFLATRL
jgi:hypothetical protein